MHDVILSENSTINWIKEFVYILVSEELVTLEIPIPELQDGSWDSASPPGDGQAGSLRGRRFHLGKIQSKSTGGVRVPWVISITSLILTEHVRSRDVLLHKVTSLWGCQSQSWRPWSTYEGLGAVLSATQELTHLILGAKASAIIIPRQQTPKPKHRASKGLAQGHPVDTQRRQVQP